MALAFSAGQFTAASAQSIEPGDHLVTLHYSSLKREDQGTVRDASTAMLSYGYQYSQDLRLLGFLGSIRTDNNFPPDTQTTRTTTYGIGVQYQAIEGGTITGTLLHGPISEDFTSGGSTTQGDGDTLTATLQYDQIVPVAQRTFLKGSVSASHSRSDFDTTGVSARQNTNRYTAGLEVMHLAGQDWILAAGLKHTRADYIITITDEKTLNRAHLSATYLFNDDFGATIGWTEALGAEDTHQRLDLSFTHRF